MKCINCGRFLGAKNVNKCPFCGAIQPQEDTISNREFYSEQIADSASSMLIVLIVLGCIFVFTPILIFNPLSIYILQLKKNFIPGISRLLNYFIMITSIIYTVTFIAIIYIGKKGVLNFPSLTINLVSKVITITIILVFISLCIAIIGMLKNNFRISGLKKILFIIASVLLFLASTLSFVLPAMVFKFPLDGKIEQVEKRTSIKSNNIQESKDSIEKNETQDSEDTAQNTPLSETSVFNKIVESGYIETASLGIAGSSLKVTDHHFKISSKQDTYKTADIYMLPTDMNTSEYQQTINDNQLDSSKVKPGEWFIRYNYKDSPSGESEKIDSLQDLPNSF